jgi:hypothetical protein
MRLDPNPLFRKIIAPWYDSNLACWLALAVMLAIAYFAILGISVARQYAAYRSFVGVPVILLVLSLLIIISLAWRLAQRYLGRGAIDKS